MASSSSSQDQQLQLRDFTMTKYQSVLDDDQEMMDDAPVRKVNAPLWLSNMYGNICSQITEMGNVIQSLKDQQQDPQHVSPGIVRAYNLLLEQQHQLYNTQTQNLTRAQRHDFARYENASIQFASETKMAIEYVRLSAESKVASQGKKMLDHIGALAAENAGKFAMVDQWAKDEMARREALAKEQRELKGKQAAQERKQKIADGKLARMEAALAKEIELRKIQEEKADKLASTRDRFKATTKRLEDQVEALGKEVKKSMEKGGASLSSSNLKKLHREWLKAVPSTKSSARKAEAETAVEVAEASAEAAREAAEAAAAAAAAMQVNNNEANAAIAAETAAADEAAAADAAAAEAEAAAAAEAAAEARAEEERSKKKGKKGKGKGREDSSGPSSSSSSSSDSESSGEGGTIESLLRDKRKQRRKERKEKKSKKARQTMADLGEVQREEREKKIQLPKLEPFDGCLDANPSYQ